MDLSKYDGRHVRITDKWGETFADRSIEEIEVHGTVDLWTGRMILRRYRPEDADSLYQYLGTDPSMYAYSGWNPYATLEMAQETVRGFIASYDD